MTVLSGDLVPAPLGTGGWRCGSRGWSVSEGSAACLKSVAIAPPKQGAWWSQGRVPATFSVCYSGQVT